MQYPSHVITRARSLRSQGKSYEEICAVLGMPVPKGTLSYWMRGIVLPPEYFKKEQARNLEHMRRIQALSASKAKERRELKWKSLCLLNSYLPVLLCEPEMAAIALTFLYWGEGGKGHNDMLHFGNSDPSLVKLFLKLLKTCYSISESKLRCRIICRADMDGSSVQKFWQEVTGIPGTQFYRPYFDKRTLGKPTKHASYKGVCVIYYLSVAVQRDLLAKIDVFGSGGR